MQSSTSQQERNSAAVAAAASSRRPALITYFVLADLPQILDHIDAVAFDPERTVIYIGSYGANPTASRLIHERGYLYAPLYSVQPGHDGPHISPFYVGRNAHAFTDEQCQELDPAYEGPIPLLVDGRPLPSHDQLAWGRELGRRYRDNLRLSRQHFAVDVWQFDELVSSVCFDLANQHHYLDFLTGILQGFRLGRPECDDEPEPGLVWCAGELLQALPHMRQSTPGLASFYSQLNHAALYLIGEEYPLFIGDPSAAATHWASPQAWLRQSGKKTLRYHLSRRYIAAFTPGIDQTISTTEHLNGRVRGQTIQEALAWKHKFLQHRLATQPAGVGEYCFRGHNTDDQAISPTLTALKAACARCT